MEVTQPDRREDVVNALELLASEPPDLAPGAHDPRWPDVTNAIHWLVDDTFWEVHDPSGHIGITLRDSHEADTIRHVVQAVVNVAQRRHPGSDDAAWFSDAGWTQVRRTAGEALTVLNRGGS